MEAWIRSQFLWKKKKEVALLALGLSSLAKLFSKYKRELVQSNYMKIAQKKREERDSIIKEELKHLPEIPEDIQKLILDSTVTELMALLNDDRITSEQILVTYHRRAITIGRDLELITESNFTDALQLARKCDEIRKTTSPEDRNKLGLLFGVPISVKDPFFVKGLDSTCGLAARCFKPSPEDGWIIKFLKEEGVIPFIKSNIPQLLVLTESPNAIWGRAQNPWNRERTTGGSCGGEGGLIASKCSPLGFGADGFGSARIPASYNGIYCFKGTQTRFSQIGQKPLNTYSISRKALIQDNFGPMGRCVNDLALFMRTIVSEKHRKEDPAIPFVPWDQSKEVITKKLKIGYVTSDDLFPASAPCRRAVLESIEKLKKLGHECEEFEIPNFRQMMLTTLCISNADGKSRGREEALEGEKPIKELSLTFTMTKKIPYLVRVLFSDLIDALGYHRWASLMKNVKELKAHEYFTVVYELSKYKKEFLDFWKSKEFDAIVMPGDALPAFKHGHGNSLALSGCYMYLGNIANLPGGSIPVSKVKPGEDNYESSGCKEHDLFYKKACESMKGSVGMPVSVCVYTLPWEDEKCIGVMRQLESQLNFHELPKL